jgi:TusA-related sulfurtransferase
MIGNTVTYVVDSRGTVCPGPITDLIKTFRKCDAGDVIELLATDPVMEADVKAWCRRTGNELLGMKKDGVTYTAMIRVIGKSGKKR